MQKAAQLPVKRGVLTVLSGDPAWHLLRGTDTALLEYRETTENNFWEQCVNSSALTIGLVQRGRGVQFGGHFGRKNNKNRELKYKQL